MEVSLIWVRDMESKKDIRKKIFAERKLRSDEQIRTMSLIITERVTALPAFKNASQILVYADYNHEVVTEYLIKGMEGRKGSCSSEGCGKGYGIL